MTPTAEQTAILDAARSTTNNLLISALAGAAKTSTLVMVAQALKRVPILCLAFNKRIALEMQERLPGNCEAMTLNSLGHRVWAQAVGKRLRVDTKKNFNILSNLIDDLPRDQKTAAFDSFADILRAIDFGKSCGYIPTGHFHEARPLCGDEDFFAQLDEEPSQLTEYLIRESSIRSIKQGLDGLIDFSDQILLPTVFPNAKFPRPPLILVDEAQDLSALNHATLRKLVKNRLIAVGDECQSIYGFRGAHEDSMALLRREFSMREMHLSISFRCPRAVISAARWRAPRMTWPDWAAEGEVTTLDTWSATILPDSAVILCRNNAPLFRTAMRLLRAGRFPELVGNDIGKNLIKILKKLGPAHMPQAEVLVAIATWRETKLAKSRDETKIHDQADCLIVFAEQGDDLGGAIAYAEHILSASGPILLMTGHKSKGLEFDNVFLLDRDLIRMTEKQDRNLHYVMQTRAKQRLTYITSEGWRDA